MIAPAVCADAVVGATPRVTVSVCGDVADETAVTVQRSPLREMSNGRSPAAFVSGGDPDAVVAEIDVAAAVTVEVNVMDPASSANRPTDAESNSAMSIH